MLNYSNFSNNIRYKAKLTSFTIPFQHVLEILANAREKKRNKRYTGWDGRNETTFYCS